MSKHPKATPIIRQPDEAPSHWQPVPANGFAECRLSRCGTPGISRFSSGIQIIGPDGHIREHQHDAADEILFFYEGEGVAIVDGVEHPIRPGTQIYVGPWCTHKFVNTGKGDLKMFWVLLPGGLEDFFQAIGRPRRPGEAAPAPFPRPQDVAQIEAATVFAPLDR
jgi:mannose-6-phosphate isomerase-like protein (cupin superfamily)